MIRVFFGSRMLRALRGLTPELQGKLRQTLSAVSEDFGNPHQHAGLGLRKLGPGTWECRFDLFLRVIFIQDREGLVAFDIMTHDQVRAWLKNR